MRERLRALERILVRQRMQLLAFPVVEGFCTRWDQALRHGGRLPDPLDLVGELVAVGVLPRAGPAIAYLERSGCDGRVPDPHRLLHLLLHGVGARQRTNPPLPGRARPESVEGGRVGACPECIRRVRVVGRRPRQPTLRTSKLGEGLPVGVKDRSC